MLKILRVISSISVMALGAYALITGKFESLPYMMFFLGVSLLVSGVLELQAKRKTSAIFTILAAAFLFYVAFYTF